MKPAEISPFDVVLKHLSPDAKKASIEIPTSERLGLSPKELRGLLRAMEHLAPTVAYPAAPEMKVTGPTGRFMVQLREGRLHFVSWASMKSRGGNPSADQIADIITGEVEEGGTGLESVIPDDPNAQRKWARVLIIAALIVVFIGANYYTYTQATKPPGNFLPRYRLMEPAPGERLMNDVAGNFETGGAPGDRRLQIRSDGAAEWQKFGAGRAVVERKPLVLQAIEVAAGRALLTSRQGLITIKDPSMLTMYGDTYIRVAK